MAITELASTKSNGLNVKLFEYDINDEQSFFELKEYLIKKIRTSKVHNTENYDLNYYGSKNLNPEFVKKFNEQVAKINIPQKTKIPQFDVRRERVTEWMAQLLLEKEYNCKFYEEADKRMTIEPVGIDKHTPGVDVPGIRMVNNQVKFVVCEVKASEDKNIPCSSVASLQEDIQKSIDNEQRVTREILQYMHGIRNIKMVDNELQKIVDFLAKLILSTKNELAESIMFFPILIRNNVNIIQNRDTGDYKNFVVNGIDNKNIENIIFAFRHSINNFSNSIYTEAIGNE
jgi:hypothetical protein